MRAVVLALACMTFVAPAFAQGPLRAADADGDGVITQAEFQANSQKNFANLDKDGDGSLTVEELQAQGGGRLGGGRFAGAGGGAPREPMSQAQFEERALQRFARLDADADGKLTAEELRAARQALGQQ